MTTSRRQRGRPRKSSLTEKAPETTPVTPILPLPLSAEVVLPSNPSDPNASVPEPVDTTPAIDVDLRRRQWDAMSNIDKGKLGMSLEEFLGAEDVTGMGANSRFTMPEERGLSKMRVALRDV